MGEPRKRHRKWLWIGGAFFVLCIISATTQQTPTARPESTPTNVPSAFGSGSGTGDTGEPTTTPQPSSSGTEVGNAGSLLGGVGGFGSMLIAWRTRKAAPTAT